MAVPLPGAYIKFFLDALEPPPACPDILPPQRRPETVERLDGTAKQHRKGRCYFCPRLARAHIDDEISKCHGCAEKFRRKT